MAYSQRIKNWDIGSKPRPNESIKITFETSVEGILTIAVKKLSTGKVVRFASTGLPASILIES